MREAWSAELDGAVYAQPLVVGDSLLVATENNTVYALDARTGEERWRRHLGEPVPLSDLPCGNIDPLGITGTPAYDEATGDVYLVTESTGAEHTLWALDARTGGPRWSRSLDVVDRDPAAEQQRSALLIAGGRVYVAFGGLFGDCADYVGYVAGVATDGKGPVLRYEVPTTREAGMWSPAGPVLDASGRSIYVASGNGEQVGGDYDGSDSVIRLSLDLRRTALFAPDTWPEDNGADLDLGSSSPVLVRDKVVIAGKRGTVYLLDADLGGIGGELSTLEGCAAYGGAASARAGGGVILPCADGIRALNVTGNRMTWRWQAAVAGSPVIADDVVYSLDLESGALVQLDLDTGKERSRVDVGPVSRFATPVPVDDLVYVGTLDGVVAISGAP